MEPNWLKLQRSGRGICDYGGLALGLRAEPKGERVGQSNYSEEKYLNGWYFSCISIDYRDSKYGTCLSWINITHLFHLGKDHPMSA